MNKDARASLLRQRFAVRGQWRAWKPTTERKGPVNREVAEQRPSRARDNTFGLLSPRKDACWSRPEWLRAPDPDGPAPTVCTKRARHEAHPITRISEIFEKARAECRPLAKVSVELKNLYEICHSQP